MIQNQKIKQLYDCITKTEFYDSDFWYISGKTQVIQIFQKFNQQDIEDFENEILLWDIDEISIIKECFTYEFLDETTFNYQSYILAFLLAHLPHNSDKLDILEDCSDVILRGKLNNVQLLNTIIEWIEKNQIHVDLYYKQHCLRIYESRENAIKRESSQIKIKDLRAYISTLLNSEINDLELQNFIKLWSNLNAYDYNHLRIDYLTWNVEEILMLSDQLFKALKFDLIDSDYHLFFLEIFNQLPAEIAVKLLPNLKFLINNNSHKKELIDQIKNKLNELIAKGLIDSNWIEYSSF